MYDFIQNLVPDGQKKGVLDCQKACVGNRESAIYVLHCHFGNPKRLLGNMELFLFIKLVVGDCR